MRAILQRVTQAQVQTIGQPPVAIPNGLLILLGIKKGDNSDHVDRFVKKVSNLRIFSDNEGKMNLSILDIKGSILLVSQFTLYADTLKGNRPSFFDAEAPDKAASLIEEAARKLTLAGVPVKSGFFGEYMDVTLNNSGPVTICLEF